MEQNDLGERKQMKQTEKRKAGEIHIISEGVPDA